MHAARLTNHTLIALLITALTAGFAGFAAAPAFADDTENDSTGEQTEASTEAGDEKSEASAEASADEDKVPVPAALDFTMQQIDETDIRLARYHGNVILLVNVASRCGLTKQYRQLQALHEQYAEQGLVILGVPANNFGKQEPGTNEQIMEFCSTKFNVEFDMLAKVSVKGDDITPLYAYLTSKKTNGDFAGPIKWNFTKFLIDREGNVIARFSPRTKPDAKSVIKAIETALAEDEPAELCEDAVAYRKALAEAKAKAEAEADTDADSEAEANTEADADSDEE